jgi:alkanesulfonate monooxygenase SsuD/methylene tetrahydromethanopterin reductase-like flavin-dependent oxidoreductase (luciferase family)
LGLDLHDPWVLLGALAQTTSRVRLGAMVTPLPRRRPWKFAREVITLDHLSHGRVIVGAGLGFPPDADFEVFGDEPDERIRGAQLDEGLNLVSALWSGEDVVHGGEHYQADARFTPLPVQRPHPPVWIACSWPKRAGMVRARSWQGIVPISADGEPLAPRTIAEIVDALGPVPDGFDVVAAWAPGYSVADYERAGATWLLESRWPDGDWFAELEASAANGPGSWLTQ